MMMNLWWRTMMMNKPWFKKKSTDHLPPWKVPFVGDHWWSGSLISKTTRLPEVSTSSHWLRTLGTPWNDSWCSRGIPLDPWHKRHWLSWTPAGSSRHSIRNIYISLYKNTCSITYIYDLYVYNLHIKKNTKNAYLIVFMRTWKLCLSLSLSLSQAAWFQAISCAEENVHVWFISVYKHVATISFVSFWDLITLALTIGSNHFCFKSKFNSPSWAAFLAEVALIHPYSSHHVFFWGVTEISMKERMSMW